MPRVLLVENEENIQKLIKVNLAASGYDVLIASEGEKGLELARQKIPDLILLDLRLPGMPGWDVLTERKAEPQLKDIPVVIVTAMVGQANEAKARDMGAAGYLGKPFTAGEVLREVRKALGQEAV